MFALALLITCFEILLMGYIWDKISQYGTILGKWKLSYWLIPTIIGQIILATFYTNDLALEWAYMFDGGTTLPYSRLWFFLNPFWQTDKLYLPYLFGWQMGFLGIYWFLIKRKVLSVRYVYWTQVFNIALITIHGPQSIVPLSFLYLVPVSIWFLIPFFILKFPLFWSWDFSDTHVACLLGKINPHYSYYLTPCGHFFNATNWNWYPTLIFNFFVYISVAIWTIGVIRIWYRKRQSK